LFVILRNADINHSLSATFFRNRVIGALRSSDSPVLRQAAQNISPNLIFEHPTVEQLAETLAAIVDPSLPSSQGTLSKPSRAVETIREWIAKYTADLPSVNHAQISASGGTPTVLLTGSTGNIGSHILASLLSNHRVGKIYALNRPSANPLERLKAAFVDRGLPVKLLLDSRLVSLVGDVTSDNFALEAEQYLEVRVTHVHYQQQFLG
jgi:hypothetical protein